MNKMKEISYIMIIVLFCTIFNVGQGKQAKAASPSVEYQAHIANEGWKSYQSNGATAGSTGKSLSLQALKVRIKGISGGITYRGHLSYIGWTSWVSNNSQAGTTGQDRPMEAVQIKLTGDVAKNYDVYYRVHVSNVGWLGWAKNGNTAGSTGCSLPMEAIQIKILAKNKGMATSQSSIKKPSLTVQAHVEDVGWQKPVSENTVSGTTGHSKRMEAMIIRCSDFMGGSGIQYRAHVQNIGWQGWCNAGTCSGTTGKSLQMEAVQIKLVGRISAVYDVYYRVHCANYGWLGWACNGERTGTIGGGIRMEAIQVKLVRKGTSVQNVISNVAYKGKMTISQLQNKFLNGKYWNHAGNQGSSASVNNQDGYTSIPCSKHGTVGTSRQTCNGFAPNGTQLSWQCMGYVEKLGYDYTGYNPRNNANGWTTSYSSSALNSLKPGDIVRYKNDGHSIFITAVNGNTVTYTDCNSDGHCKIRWNATISKATLKSSFTYVRVAPYQIQ